MNTCIIFHLTSSIFIQFPEIPLTQMTNNRTDLIAYDLVFHEIQSEEVCMGGCIIHILFPRGQVAIQVTG